MKLTEAEQIGIAKAILFISALIGGIAGTLWYFGFGDEFKAAGGINPIVMAVILGIGGFVLTAMMFFTLVSMGATTE